MILNTGNRTDIPAFFSEWFYNRVREQSVMTRNPYFPEQITKYSITPELVDIICFCSKNPAPMLPRLGELSAFGQFWFVTITPYGKDIEPFVPKKEEVMESLRLLSASRGINAVSWRYDPIFISDKYNLDFHIQTFESMAQNLAGYVNQCVISFIDLYAKTKRNFKGVREVTKEEQELLVAEFVKIGRRFGIQIRTCCEKADLASLGADVSGCMTKQVLENALGQTLHLPKRRLSTREECSCLLGCDIGMYNTCGHGCLYCYANYDRNTVIQNLNQHDPTSPLLIGNIKATDKITESQQQPFCNGQMRLFL